jgi:dihydroflavonol-4-reductase
MTGTVLLTGVSGYIGLHCASHLLKEGFIVRGSVRSAAKGKEVIDSLSAASVDISRLSIVELDLTSDLGWEMAVSGCDYVMHVASPYVVANPKHEGEMITPAVDGTLRVLRASEKAKVNRVVLTSSALTMMASLKTGTFSSNDWADTNSPHLSTYAKSKILAEKAAWDFIAHLGETKPIQMVSINPGIVFGPPLGRDISGQSMSMLDQMLRGKVPMVPNTACPAVDVRDVALLHVEALTNPDVVGKRIIASSSESHGFAEVAQILKEEGYKGPSTRVAPNLLLRIAAIFDREARGMLGYLDMDLTADTSATRQLFDWTPIPFTRTVLDSAAAVKRIQDNS